MNNEDKLCPVVVQATLDKHRYSITETAKELVVSRAEVYKHVEQYGLRLRPEGEVPPLEIDPKEELRKALKIAEEIILYCDQVGNFSNGNTHAGYDEGQVQFSNFMYMIEKQIKELKLRNNL